jgi:hypothetical protein
LANCATAFIEKHGPHIQKREQKMKETTADNALLEGPSKNLLV